MGLSEDVATCFPEMELEIIDTLVSRFVSGQDQHMPQDSMFPLLANSPAPVLFQILENLNRKVSRTNESR